MQLRNLSSSFQPSSSTSSISHGISDRKTLPSKISDRNSAPGKWAILDSDVFGECVLLIQDKRWFTEARQKHPDLVIYFPQEIERLKKFTGSDVDLLAIHRVKKAYRAWIIR